MTFLNRHRSRIRPVGPFAPSSLFFGGIPGAWYDPTDLSTMFQDNTGLTPVTAVEQPVGLVFDKSQGTPAARYNLLTFSEQMDNGAWTKSSAGTGSAPVVTPNAGVAPDGTLTADSVFFNRGAGNAIGDQSVLAQTPTVVSGTYTQSVWLKAAAPADVGKQLAMRNVAGSSYLVVTLTADWVRYTRTETGSLAVWDLTSRGTITTGNSVTALVWGAQLQTGSTATTYQRITTGTGGEWTPGNHASQSTAASRPTYRARYNLLTFSEDFGNAAWIKLNASASTNVTTSPDGTVTADALVEDAANTFHIVSRGAGSVSCPGIGTFSCYLKASTRTAAVLQINEGANRYAALFDLTNGVVAATNTTGTPTSTSNSIASVGNGWYRCTVSCAIATTCDTIVALSNSLTPVWTSSVPTYAGNGTSGVFLWGAQLLTAADVTATGNAYQRIAAATVYDTAPIFRPYLAFDGVDDSLSTAAINFTSTDKMTVFAGVTKLGSSFGVISELGNNGFFNAGNFYLATGSGTGIAVTPVDATAMNGNATYAADYDSAAPPVGRVYSQLMDMSQPTGATEMRLRINAAFATINGTLGTSAGTGTFANAALNIGQRAGGSFRLNGRLYSLIVRGAASSVTEIADTELWVNARTGAY